MNDEWSCPAPATPGDRVLLGHGSGGRLSQRLFEEEILPAFSNSHLDAREDGALLELGGTRLAFSTDSFVVTPLFFPGGDIGRLAVHGTVNDLAMAGARPRFLSVGLILEEGLPLATLRRVLASMAEAARASGVEIATGDTKVVARGAADQLFINTSGVGEVPPGRALSSATVRPGDRVILSGTLADHGMAVLSAREGLGLGDEVVSDSAPLHELTQALFESGAQVRCLRDPTRGGLAASLTEIAARSQIGIELDERLLPVKPAVRAACELLGLDPLHVANEGKLIAVVAAPDADKALAALRSHWLGREAALIGRALAEHPGALTAVTAVGGRRFVDLPLADPLPRIC